MGYIITEGSIENLEEIVKLNRKIFTGMYENEPYSLAKYKSRLNGKIPLINIARVNNSIIANSIAFRDGNSLYLWILAVSKEHRREGIASQLFKLLEQSARDEGLDSVTIKIYSVSEEMQQLLRKREYEITKTDDHGAIYFKLKL